MSDKLVEYVERGVKQGFNTEYIRKVLLKHGYSKAEVEFAIAKGAPDRVTYKPTKEHKLWLSTAAAAVAVVLLILFGLWLQSHAKERALESELVEKEQDAQNYLDRVATLSEEIDAKERTIDQQIEELKAKDTQNQQLLQDIDQLYKEIKHERTEVRDMLLQLLQDVIRRFEPEVSAVEE